MTNTEIAIAFSNGRWRSAKDLAAHMGLKNPSDTPLKNLFGARGVSFEAHKNGDGHVTRYRAYYTSGKSPVELAKARKAMGVVVGLESISILGCAA